MNYRVVVEPPSWSALFLLSLVLLLDSPVTIVTWFKRLVKGPQRLGQAFQNQKR